VEPNDIIFVMDSTIGQAAKDQAEAFKDAVKVGSVILTKLDGHAKGGGAISAVAATESPIVFIGTGEHMDDFESFEAKRFVQRLLGMGDIKGLLLGMGNIDLEKSAPAMMARLQKGEFSLRDMREQFQMVLKMGPLDKMIGMLPGFAGDMIPKGKEKESEARIKGFLIMMDSMTFDELDGIDSGRAKKSNGKMAELKWADQRMGRVARGSGYSMQHVFTLLEERKRMAKVIDHTVTFSIPLPLPVTLFLSHTSLTSVMI
jgi:signal recognition particle subunit SRP54